MRALLSLLIFSLCYSCTKKASLTKDAMGLRFNDVHMEISHLNDIDWHVGKHREETITQSIVFMVAMPKVSDEDLEHLTQFNGVNSWILRVIMQRGSERQDLGSLYTLFRPKKVIRGQSGGSPSNVTVKIYYAAAYASERFRAFKCPAFEHNKRVKSMSIKGNDASFELTPGQVSPYPEKSQLVELTPSSFNAGNSLVGEYFIEVAPYDYEKKIIHAPFKRIPMYVEVAAEESVSVKSCLGEHPEIQ